MLAGMNAMTALAVDMSLPAMPAIGREFAAPPDRVQLTLSLFMFGYALGQLLCGPLSDRFGRRPAILIGLSVYTLCGLGCVFSPDIDTLVGFRFFQAIAAAVGPSLSRAIIRDYHGGPRASHMLSSVQLAMGCALVVAPILGSLLLSVAGWRAIFLALAAFGAVLTLIVWFGFAESLTAPNRQSAHPARIARNIALFFRTRVCVGYALINGCIQGGLLAYISGIPYVMIDVFHVAPRNFGFYFALAAGGLILGASTNRRLVRRFMPEQLLRGGLFVQACAGLVLLAQALAGSDHPLLFMLPVMAYSFSQGLVTPNAVAGAMEPYPYMAGLAAALLGAAQMSSGGVAGYVVNALYNGTAVPLAGTVALLSCCGLAAYHLVIYRRKPAVA